jgi:hypothetical protein
MKTIDNPVIRIASGHELLTGWHCAICLQNATVDGEGWKMCDKHWRDWDFGYGKTIEQMRDEHERRNNTATK